MQKEALPANQEGWTAEGFGAALSFTGPPHVWTANIARWRTLQLCEPRRAILQRAAGPSFCWAGFPPGTWRCQSSFQLLRKRTCAQALFSPQVLLVPFQALRSAFALGVPALPPLAESCYFQTLGVKEQEGIPSTLLTNLQMHGTIFFFF